MVIEVKDLHKHFGPKEVLKGVGFHTGNGTALGLLGRNGAGKTTTIRIVMGVFPADSGQVLVDGTPINHRKINIGYLPEERGLYPKVQIRDQLTYLAQLRGMQKKAARESIRYWLERLEMQDTADKKLNTLSKGNQQKIQLAAALVTNPDVVILDEPFSGLDPVNAALLKDVVKELIAQGKILLFSSHQMNYVEEFCNAVAILHQGRIALSGPIDEIKRSYDRSTLVVKTQSPEQLQALCREKGGEVIRKLEMESGTLWVTMRSEDLKAQVMSLLVASGVDIEAIAVHEPSLNDIFIQTVGEGEAEDETV